MTAANPKHSDGDQSVADSTSGFRHRLLDALAAVIADKGYTNTTVADIVRQARTSRRTFYEYFADRQSCLIALLTDTNAANIRAIGGAVDGRAPWQTQVTQAVLAWIDRTDATPTLTLTWIRDAPALGASARELHWAAMDAFVDLVQALGEGEVLRESGVGPISRQRAILLLGGLRELTAYALENGTSARDISDEAVAAAVALLAPRR
ncbi:TetR/AcrR family transcriptional regulator [Aldersonia kunmingensis]|uniref:TetR/AcrR family transcriptional regulator n=1 Tax=Aldersonia kunmingensis TaxID=408066 RepID=UPI00082D99E7|nr:TetR/AcrR family transcriptional regulator [Aldersonia kunmingensis]